MLSENVISVAIHYLFPTLLSGSNTYRRIATFIQCRYAWLGTAVLYYKNKQFMDIIESEGLSIGTAEVIVSQKGVRATSDYSNEPQQIFVEK